MVSRAWTLQLLCGAFLLLLLVAYMAIAPTLQSYFPSVGPSTGRRLSSFEASRYSPIPLSSPDAIRDLTAFVRRTPPTKGDRGSATNMTVLAPSPDYATGMALSHALFGSSRSSDTRLYTEPLLFHAYWKGPLLEKHVTSVQSCWLHNMRDDSVRSRRRIVVWTDDAGLHRTNASLLSQFAQLEGVELRLLDIHEEAKGSPIQNSNVLHVSGATLLSFYSDVVRYALLHRYGGVWFDLDILWLRPIDPLLLTFDTRIMVYSWQAEGYPNGAVFISLQSRSAQLASAIHFILSRRRGFGFQEAALTYDLPLDFLVLPCSWFDPGWQLNPLGSVWRQFILSRPSSLQRCTWDNFHAGAFAFHWHNQWTDPINATSCMSDLQRDLQRSIQLLLHSRKEEGAVG